MSMNPEHFEVLLNRDSISQRVAQLGVEITGDLQGANLCIIPVMDGGMIFAADLMREISLPQTLCPIKASSYGNATISSGSVQLSGGIPEGVSGKACLLIDDILDTGKTLEVLRSSLFEAGAKSVCTCVLLRKEHAKHLPADYIGFDIPDTFVVGYGLDLAGNYRNLPDVRVYKEFS
jgi:hypoxanthine phosphoribosyltransferase